MWKIFIIISLSCLLSSCVFKAKIPPIDNFTIEQRIEKSDKYRAIRKLEANSLTLDEKEYYLLDRLQKRFIIYDEFLVKRYNYKDASNISAHIDESALYLAYLANRAASLKNDQNYQKAALNIVKGIYYLDNLNKFDGYLPRYVTLKDNIFTPGSETIRTNSYAILFFAYYQAYQNFQNITLKNLIKNHIELIIKYYLQNDLDLHHHDGMEVKYSSLKSKILSHQLSALTIFEIANIIVTDKQLKSKIQQKLAYFYKKGYKKYNKIMRNSLGFWQFSSHSSNWLNMLKLYVLVIATNDSIYKNNFKNLYKILANDDNIFYNLLYDKIFPLNALQKRKIITNLNNYPISLDNHEIINSSRSKIELDNFPKIIKNKRHIEGLKALPIFDRPLVYFEWKNNQFRLDGNFAAKGNIEYSGLDFLLSYAILLNKKHL
jgi:hypothetical protein